MISLLTEMGMHQMILGVIDTYRSQMYILQLVFIIVTSFVILSIILRAIKKFMLQKVKTKKQMSNITVFIDLLKYFFAFFLFIIAIISYYNSWAQIGFIAGLLSVALGLALQKPIAGLLAWLIIVVRRPIAIGDRVNILDINGDITNITLSHIVLDEVGGTVGGEEKSGRTVMVPNSIIFEKELINYTHRDEYVLDEITANITYESNLESAEKIMISAVEEVMKPLWDSFPEKVEKQPHTRLFLDDSGIDVTVRYYTVAPVRNAISTNIIREIHRLVTKSNDVEFAYPHSEVILKEKSISKKREKELLKI